jgi:heat shock protein HslJ
MQNDSSLLEPSRVQALHGGHEADLANTPRGAVAIRLVWGVGLCLLSAIALAGCAATQTTTETPSLEGSAWVLASLPGRSLVPDVTPTARFEAGRVSGSDGCNRYSMPFTAQGFKIEIGPLGPSTMMACPESAMAQANTFTTALRSARSFRRGAGTLEFLDANGTVLVTFAAQANSLAGTSWSVVNINNGRQAVVGMVSGSTVTMAFDTAGRVSGTAGCNRYHAAYKAGGDTLRFSSVAATRMACAEPAVDEQERAFLRALESVATLGFEGNRLVMRDQDGAMAIILERK